MADGSLVLSSEAWFLGRVLAGKDWTRGFDDAQRSACAQAKTLLNGVVSDDALRALTQWILEFLGVAGFFGEKDAYPFRFRSQPVKPNKPESEDDPLNSFFLDELALVAESIREGVKSQPLDQYLRRHDPQSRLHVDDDRASQALIERLAPAAYANSCWPTERHLGLVHSQQLAVNTILSTLGNGRGVLGVNGPPGTGKTTLLRDLIAAVITGRADELAKLRRASDAFARSAPEIANHGGREQSCFKLNPALYGFEIVVASSNNGAVENVTLELPQRDKIDESWLPEAEYFADLGKLITEKAAWGMISGALGSKSRRTEFVNRYFFGQPPFDSKGKEEPSIKEGTYTEPNRESDDVAAHSPPEKEKIPQGFMGWLGLHVQANRQRDSDEREAIWKHAVTAYEAAKTQAREACTNASRIGELIKPISQARETIAAQSDALRTLHLELSDVVSRLLRLDTEESAPAETALQECLTALANHQASQPSFWAKLFSLWKAQRTWDATRELLEDHRDVAKSAFDRIARRIKQLCISQERLQKQTTDTQQAIQRLQNQLAELTKPAVALATACHAEHLLAWLQGGAIGRGDAIELAEPWRIEGWRQARARVFIQALKLHKTFFELEASRMRSNLFLINGMLTGTRFQGFSHDAIRSAWASLFMVVPVLSSTFASFSRSFGSLGAGDIGWLLVDEAGQAPPQAAVGALWRSRRALLVGDPLQLKPIVTVSDAVLEHMRKAFRVDAHWLPNRQSAQSLADEATAWGRMAGPADGKVWVGLPLVVHRRSDRPMYELANRIAYDGAMVYGTLAPRPNKETHASLPTGWIHASGPSEGNWVPAEGQALENLLALLQRDGVPVTDISVITPFKAVRECLTRRLDEKMVSGTIHTMQGKEAQVVIMVLGGNTAGPGARDWAVSEPNLLNVAATRAKRRFYVIGDRNDWKNRALFCDVMDLLPLQRIP